MYLVITRCCKELRFNKKYLIALSAHHLILIISDNRNAVETRLQDYTFNFLLMFLKHCAVASTMLLKFKFISVNVTHLPHTFLVTSFPCFAAN